MTKSVHNQQRILVMIPSSSDWYRQTIEGIAAYARKNAKWMIYFQPVGLSHERRFSPDPGLAGVIARVSGSTMESDILATKIPAVNVSWRGEHRADLPKVTVDEEETGRLAADYLREKFVENFAYVGPLVEPDYAPRMRLAFQRMLESAGFTCDAFLKAGLSQEPTEPPSEAFTQWVAELPKPVGVLTYNGISAVSLEFVCINLGLRIPEDVAILSAEKSPLVSSLAPVEVSSIDTSPRRVGYEAAQLLHALMNGESPPESQLEFPPAGIIEHRSTETVAIDDEDLRAVLKYIRENAQYSLQIADLLKVRSMSRRRLELKFRQLLGTTPAAEIRRIRLERAKRLLGDSDLTIVEISHRVGFEHAEVLARNFRKEFGMTPGDYRRTHRPEAS